MVVISGADKGKSGKVIKSFPALLKIIVEGVNVRKKHQRPTRSNQKGQIIEKAVPIHVSNVAIADPSNGKPSRVGIKIVGEKRIRVTKKSGATL